MKWFHHEVDSMHSEKLSALISEFGFEGYGRYWRILEIVAERMDGSGRFWAEYPMMVWLQKLAVRRPLFNRYLVVISQLFDIKLVSNGLLLRIEIPNLLKWQDNYTKDLEAKSKKLPSKERDKERDKDKDFKPLVHPPKKTAAELEVKTAVIVEAELREPGKQNIRKPYGAKVPKDPGVFERIWGMYPHRVGKKAAERHFNVSVDIADTSQIEIAIEHYKAYTEAMRRNGHDRAWQNGATWFNNWQDWIEIKEVQPPMSRPDRFQKPDLTDQILRDMREGQ